MRRKIQPSTAGEANVGMNTPRKEFSTPLMEHVIEVLETGRLSEFIGWPEGLHFEAKSEPYDLDSSLGRYELAKDISAFANTGGGCLVIGLATVKDKDRELDVVDSLSLIAPDAVEENRYVGVLGEYVYPKIAGLDVRFFPHAKENNGVVCIFVPPQNPNSRPFLICKVVDSGESLKHIVAGYVERHEGNNRPLSPQELHRRFNSGSSSTAERLGRIEDKLDILLDSAGGESSEGTLDRDLRKKRVSDILDIDE